MSYKSGTIASHCEKMRKKGVSEGGALRPDSASETPDLHEIHVITLAKQYIEQENSEKTDTFVKVERNLQDLNQKIDVVDASCNNLLEHDLLDGAFQSALVKTENNLVSTCAKELETKAVLTSFKIRNEISEPAQYPADILFHFSLIILFIAIETAANAFFYQGASGWVGGAVIALSVSVVNMCLAAGLGAQFRYVNLPEIKNKIIGYSGIGLFIGLAIALNLIFSTFRIQYQLLQEKVINSGLPDATSSMLVEAFKTAFMDAFGVFILKFPEIDVESFILFFVGLLCSILAFWKGYTHDDKYPGYGRLDRLYKSAENQFLEAKNKAFEDAMAKVGEVENDVEELKKSLIAAQRSGAALKAEIQSAQYLYEGNTKKIQNELNLVIEAYRGANKATRTTAAPNYFNVEVNIIPSDDKTQLESLLSRIENFTERSRIVADEKVPLLGNRLHEIRGRINQLVQKAFQDYLKIIVDKATIALRAHGQVQREYL